MNTYLLEWTKSGTLTTAITGKDVKQQELSFTASENETQCNGFGRECEVSEKTKHSLTIGSIHHTPWYLSKEVKDLHLHKYAHKYL